MTKIIKRIFVVLMTFLLTNAANADGGKCVGKFVNPITDICWSCIFPISIGGISIKSGSSRRDTDNPNLPVCGCMKKIPPSEIPVPVPGIAIGFWEPIRLVDVTRNPFCLVSMGGIDLGHDRHYGSFAKKYDGEEHNQHAFYHTHYYMYPLIYWLELLTDFTCLEEGSMDVFYMSEFDPMYKNSANFLSPEAYLFANPIAQAACSADCLAATTDLPKDSLFWCVGCQGSIYPFSGHVTGHIGGVQSSSLLATRMLARLHRLGQAKKTATDDGGLNGPLCKKETSLKIVKSQYRLQMTYPIPASSGEFTCNPIGMSPTLFNSGKEFPYEGEDFGYLVWRKKNCCLL